MNHSPSVTAVIVTHNSPSVLKRVIEALLAQTLKPQHIIVVDSGSFDPGWVRELAKLDARIEVVCQSNIGFAAANNLAMRHYADKTDYFLLVNPDALLAPDWVAGAHAYLGSSEAGGAGIVSSPLRGMDVVTEQPTGYWDTLGIYRNLSGRWHDRGMQERITDRPAPPAPYHPAAICGALMFVPATIYRKLSLRRDFFDESFHTFKEDIELSLRVRRNGYSLVMLPQLVAWHCRGWPKRRRDAPYRLRMMSARNEIVIAARYSVSTLPIYIMKYLYVATIERWLSSRREVTGR